MYKLINLYVYLTPYTFNKFMYLYILIFISHHVIFYNF